MKSTVVWAMIAGIAAIIGVWITLTQMIIVPLERRVDVGRENVREALIERDARMDYLQKQIDELERRVPSER